MQILGLYEQLLAQVGDPFDAPWLADAFPPSSAAQIRDKNQIELNIDGRKSLELVF